MHKVMLIDDDVPMLKYLRQLIDWESCGVHVVGDTYSSVRARHLFQELLPDIVVTDIGLPQIDGLELAAEFIRLKPGVRIIFLTCHEDFHYAKKALLLNADDYLIKDELTGDQLEASLRQSVEKLEKSAGTLEQVSYREDLNRNIDILKESLFQRLIAQTDAASLLGYARRLGISWEYPSFLLLLGHVSYAGLLPKYRSEDIPVIRYGIYNIASELAREYEGITVFNHKQFLVVLLNYRSGLTFGETDFIRRYAAELQSKCGQYLQADLSFMCGPGKLTLEEVGAQFQEMARHKYKTYYAELPFEPWRLAAGEPFIHSGEGLFETDFAHVQQAVQDQDAKELERGLERIEEAARDKLVDPADFIRQCAQRLRLIQLKLRPGTDEDASAGLKLTLRLSDTMGVLRFRLLQLLQAGRAAEPAVKEPKLQAIDDYIFRHLGENISSIDVAEHLYMNPSYFSRYFKRLTGESFTDYAHRYKIRLAAKALQTTDDPIELIAIKFGYSDRTYFSKVFKKYNGQTPREYREQ